MKVTVFSVSGDGDDFRKKLIKSLKDKSQIVTNYEVGAMVVDTAEVNILSFDGTEEETQKLERALNEATAEFPFVVTNVEVTSMKLE